MVAAKPEPSPQIVCEGIKPQVQIPWRPNQSPYVIAPSRPIKDVDLREKNLMALFKNQMNALDLLPDESTERNFINEIRNNPEIGEEELTIIYQRTQYSETQRHSEKLAGKFDPYYHSSNLVTANQWIAKFYLILTDHYRMSAKEFFAAGKPEDELRSDTPDHVRWYIARKVSNRMLD